MAVEVDALQRDLDGAEEQLHGVWRCSDDVCAIDKDKEQSANVKGVEEELRREVGSILERVQGLKLCAQASALMLGQRMDSLNTGTAKVGDLVEIQDFLEELKKTTLGV